MARQTPRAPGWTLAKAVGAIGLAIFVLAAPGRLSAGHQVEPLTRLDPSLVAEPSLGFSSTAQLPSPSMSSDGRYTVFVSSTIHLVPDLVPSAFNYDNVYLYDRVAGTCTLVSHGSAASTVRGNGHSENPTISADGHFVVYQSVATNLVAGGVDTNGASDVFLYDRTTGTTTLVSSAAGAANTAANGASNGAFLSSDGNWIAFSSAATNLVAGVTDTNGSADVFLYNRATAALTLVSRNATSATTTGNGSSGLPSLSSDGTWLVFLTSATNLLAVTDSNSGADVFLYNRVTGARTLVSHASSSLAVTGSGLSDMPSISADGSYVAFRSLSGNLVTGQVNPMGGGSPMGRTTSSSPTGRPARSRS